MKGIEDKIIESIRLGNEDKALTFLYGKPLAKIRKYILNNSGSSDDAHDIFQDAVLILFYKVKTGQYSEHADLVGFLYTVARNLWIDRMRREKRFQNHISQISRNETDWGDQLKELLDREKSEAFKKVFEQLGENCQKLLHLAVFEKLSMRQISEKMGYSNENVAKSNHYRCKQYLGKLVKENSVIFNLLKN